MSTGLDTNYLDRCDDKEEIKRLRDENAALRAKMAGMVCGTCKGSGTEPSLRWTDPATGKTRYSKTCPVCQPKEGT